MRECRCGQNRDDCADFCPQTCYRGFLETPRGEQAFPPRMLLHKAATAVAGWRRAVYDEARVTP